MLHGDLGATGCEEPAAEPEAQSESLSVLVRLQASHALAKEAIDEIWLHPIAVVGDADLEAV